MVFEILQCCRLGSSDSVDRVRVLSFQLVHQRICLPVATIFATAGFSLVPHAAVGCRVHAPANRRVCGELRELAPPQLLRFGKGNSLTDRLLSSLLLTFLLQPFCRLVLEHPWAGQ